MNTANVKSRGYLKIESAARAFDFDFRGRIVLDIGSSTGGFTEYALEHGAKKVIAVEKGTNQMRAPIRFNSKVELYEKTDIFRVGITKGLSEGALRGASPSLTPSERPFVMPPDVILADVSFVPLTKILKYAKMELARSDTEFLVMLKPQFETTNSNDLNRGVVKNSKIRREIIKRFELWLNENGFKILNKVDNETHGKHGNQERFYHLRLAK